MRLGEIYKGYFPFVGSATGKARPAIFLSRDGSTNNFYKITTQYEGKSDFIKAKYFRIEDWKAAGLYKPSYIDTNIPLKMEDFRIKKLTKIGKLTRKDMENFIKFDVEKSTWFARYEEVAEEAFDDELEDDCDFEPEL